MRKRWNMTIAALMATTLLVLSGCGAKETASTATTASGDAGGKTAEPKKVVLRLKWVHQAQFAGYYAAAEKGFYKEAGLDVEIRPGGSDFPAIQMVASGSEDFGVTGADQILMAREKGVPVKALSAVYRKTPFVLFTLKESGITTMQQLEGQKIGVKLGGNEELTYRAMVKSSGIDGKKIDEMPIKYDLSPLLSGQVKAWPGYVNNEVLSAQEQGHEVNIIKPSDYDINFYADTLFTRDDLIEKDPETVKRFVQASMKGWDYAIKNPDEAAEFGMKYSKELNLDHEKNMMKSSIDLLELQTTPLGKMDEKAWTNLQDNLIELGFMKEKQDLSKVFTNDYLE